MVPEEPGQQAQGREGLGGEEQRQGEEDAPGCCKTVCGKETISRPVEISRVSVAPGVFDVSYSDGSVRRHVNLLAAVVLR